MLRGILSSGPDHGSGTSRSFPGYNSFISRSTFDLLNFFLRSVLYQTTHLRPMHKFYRTCQNPPARISLIADRKYQCHSFLLFVVIKDVEAHHHDSHWCLRFQLSSPNRLSIFCFLKFLRPTGYGKYFLRQTIKIFMGAKIVMQLAVCSRISGICQHANCRLPILLLWIFFIKASHSESIAMTNKEILHADLLDILFENRNKAYRCICTQKKLQPSPAMGVGDLH